jgi:hypothetical protein
MAIGKKQRKLPSTYGRRNNNANQAQRIHDLFSANNDRLDRDTVPNKTTPAGSSSVHTKKTLGSTPLRSSQTAEPTTEPIVNKSTTMAIEPNEEDVQTVMAVTGCAQDIALRYLRVKKTTEAALNAILDGEDISKEESSSVWTEDVWNTDREGNMNTGDSNLRPLGGTSTAPTRVPSPSGNMSVPANRDDEDAQLAQAIAASQGQNGSMMAFQQESGIVHADGTSQQSYGPVTKDQSAHDKQWGMVPISARGASSEIVPDVERPEERKNMEGEPRFLKNLPMGGYLPNFLTIGHSIPMMREALLMRDYTMAQYGADAEWWKGHQIALPKIVHTESGAPADAEIDKWDEFIAETQRLMAALDASDRSYASAHALTQSDIMSHAEKSDMVASFIQRFVAASDARTDHMEEIRSFFCTKIGSSQGMNQPFAETLDVSFETTENDDKVGLLEVLDSLLWDTRSKDCEDRDNYVEKGADVLVLSAKQENPKVEKLQLQAPSTLYIDKYLQKNLEISKPLRLEIAEQRRRFTKLNTVINKLTEWPHPTQKDTKLDARVMLQHTLGHFSGKNMADASKADSENGIVVNGAAELPHYADIAAKLEAISLSVDKKIAKLQEQKEEIQRNISKLSNSSPSQLEEEGLKERYTLMGVATKPNITYVLRVKADRDDDNMSTDSQDEATPDGMQWWRIEYAVNGTQPHISKVQVEGHMVIQAIEVEHTSALLIYASDRAVDFSHYNPDLPPTLQKFVEDDNLHFNIELHDATRNHPPPAYNNDYDVGDSEIPRQSIEPTPIRRASMDSTCANLSGGNSRRGSFDEDAPIYSSNDYGGGGFANSGLPPDSTNRSSSATVQHVENHNGSEDVTEIHLSPPHEPQQEMVETKREGYAAAAAAGLQMGSDATMEDDGGQGGGGRS